MESHRPIELILERCAQLPLRIMGCDQSTSQYIVELVLAHPHRTVEWNLQVEDSDSWCFKRPMNPDSCLARLSHLSLELIDSYDSDSDNNDLMSGTIIGSRLFGRCGTPELRHLSLFGLRFPWARGFYKDLHTLTIENVPMTATSRRDKDIRWVIRESPQLHYLELSFWYSGAQNELNDNSRDVSRITLPSLHTVKFQMSLYLAHWLLSVIDAPSIEVLHVCTLGNLSEGVHSIGGLLTIQPGLDMSRILGNIFKLEVHMELENSYSEDVIVQLLGYAVPQTKALRLAWSERLPAIATLSLRGVFQAIQSHGDLPLLQTLVLNSHESSWAQILRRCGRKIKEFAPEWPALPSLVLKFPFLTSVKLQGTAHLCVTGQQQHDAALDDIEALPNLERVEVEGELEHDCAQRLWAWCMELPSLNLLDMNASIITFRTFDQARAFVRQTVGHSNAVSFIPPKSRFLTSTEPIEHAEKDSLAPVLDEHGTML